MAQSDPFLLPLPAAPLGRGDLCPPRTPIAPLSAGRVGQVAMHSNAVHVPMVNISPWGLWPGGHPLPHPLPAALCLADDTQMP